MYHHPIGKRAAGKRARCVGLCTTLNGALLERSSNVSEIHRFAPDWPIRVFPKFRDQAWEQRIKMPVRAFPVWPRSRIPPNEDGLFSRRVYSSLQYLLPQGILLISFFGVNTSAGRVPEL